MGLTGPARGHGPTGPTLLLIQIIIVERVVESSSSHGTNMCYHPRGTTASQCALTTTPGCGAFNLAAWAAGALQTVTTRRVPTKQKHPRHQSHAGQMAWSAVATLHVTTRRAPGSKHTTNTNATKTQQPFGTRRLGTQVRDEGAQGEACPKPRSSHTKWGEGRGGARKNIVQHDAFLFCYPIFT